MEKPGVGKMKGMVVGTKGRERMGWEDGIGMERACGVEREGEETGSEVRKERWNGNVTEWEGRRIKCQGTETKGEAREM